MFVTLRLITLQAARLPQRDALIVQLREAASALGDVASLWMAPIADANVINAGHIVWRMAFATEGEAAAVQLDPAYINRIKPLLEGTAVTAVGYRVTRSEVNPSGAGIWRALIFRVTPAGFPDQAAALERSLLLFPKYISAIRSWALSAVALVEGQKAFTHVWEQEFDQLTGLTVDYMVHPIHWAVADSWFDAECPNYVVDPHLIQVVASIDRTIMN